MSLQARQELIQRPGAEPRKKASTPRGLRPSERGVAMAGAAPGGHKLTNVEAQRIMAILEETYSKLDLMSKVPPLQLPGRWRQRLR